MIVHSIRQLARHLGKNHTMLNLDLSRGKFRQEPGGGFDVEKVRTALARSGDPSQPQRHESPPNYELGISGSAYEIFNRARAAKQLTIAKERQLNLKKRQGELLEESDVRRTWTDALARFENRLRQIPDILAPRVAAMDNVLEICALVAKEIESALRALYEAGADEA